MVTHVPDGETVETPDLRIEIERRGRRVTIRPITPDDREREAAFVRRLSPQSRYYRFHSSLRELTPELLARFTRVDYPDDMALVATVEDAGEQTQIGVARYATTPPGSSTAEVAIVVEDAWQGRGIGSRLLLELRRIALAGGIRHLHMRVLPENRRMIELAERLGYEPRPPDGDFRSRTLGKPLRQPEP